MTRGFITIATGAEHYYKLARQLLRSFRCRSDGTVPFALICDRENEYTSEFDHVIILEHPCCSYLDKLLIYRYSPFEETIFIDADSLVMKDPSVMWEDFSGGSPVSCYGKTYPIGSDGGWFRWENTGKWKNQIRYQIDLHGGTYYFRRGMESEQFFDLAITLAQEYDSYDFKDFVQPADEPVMALTMAIHGCLPSEKKGRVAFLNSLYGRLSLSDHGELYQDGRPCDAIICHFATRNTRCYLYRYLSAAVDLKYLDPSTDQRPDKWKIRRETIGYDLKNHTAYICKRLIKRCVPRDKLKKLKKMLSGI